MLINLINFLTTIRVFTADSEWKSRKSLNITVYETAALKDSKNVSYYPNWGDNIINTTLGRFLNKFYDLSPAAITHICEKVKSKIEDPGDFKIIEGSDITNAYFHRNYVPSHGTLNNSCMRYKKCQDYKYFKVYEDHAKMLIMTPHRGKRIMGRALLWKYGDTYLMDRVYTTDLSITYKFYDYAKSQGFGVLVDNTYVCNCGQQQWYLADDNYTEPIKANVKIYLDEPYLSYPFIDSVCYYNPDERCLQTEPYIKNNEVRICHATNGRILKYGVY